MDSGSADLLKIETCERAPGKWAVRLAGSLDSSNVSRVERAFDELFAKGVYKLLVNLKELTYISSDGLGCFISAYVSAIKRGGRIVFAATPPDVRDVFELVGLHQILRFAEDEEAALRQLDG